MKRINCVKKTKMLSPSRNSDFFLLANQMITLMKNECRPKTVYNCQTALRSLQRYLDCCRPELRKRLPLRLLTSELTAHFHRYHVQRGVGENAIRAYLRSLRSLVNRLRKKGYPLGDDIFSLVHTSPLPGGSVPLSEVEMRRISMADVRPESSMAWARDLALFTYLAGGIAFVDLAHLRSGNYDAGTGMLTFRRQKTGVEVRVSLPPVALGIWRKYGKQGAAYHFGLVSTNHPDDYANALTRYNRSLRSLALRSGIHRKVTSYTLRHTFATIARHNYGAPLDLLSLPLGHRSERTTALYVDRPTYDMLQRLQCKMERNLMK